MIRELCAGSLPVILSPKFYTSQPGFRLQLLLVPNSTYSDGNSYLGLFVRLVTGSFDSDLNWPYQFKTELSLLDLNSSLPLDERKNVSFTITPNRDVCRLRSAFLRPSTDTDNSPRPDGCGNRRHVPLVQLFETKNVYVLNNEIVIRTVVALNDVGESYQKAKTAMKFNTLVSEYVWSIPGFTKIQSNSMENDTVAILSSDPFYTNENGYLMQMFLTLLPKKRAFAISTAFVQGDFDR